MSIALSQVTQKAHIDQLRIHSFETGMYLVQIQIDNDELMVCDDHGKLLRFSSTLAAKKPFKGLSIKETVLVHSCVYDEKIGLDHDSDPSPMVVRLCHPDNDPA